MTDTLLVRQDDHFVAEHLRRMVSRMAPQRTIGRSTRERSSVTVSGNGVAETGDCGRSTSGDDGRSVTGEMGVAIAGDGGVAIAGDQGHAVSGDRGVSVSGIRGVAISGVGGTAQAGAEGSIAIAGMDRNGLRYVVVADIDPVNGPSADHLYALDGHRFVLVHHHTDKEVGTDA